MKKFTLLAFLLSFFSAIAIGQTLLTSQFLGHKTKAQLVQQFGNPLFKNGVNYYKITYETPDVQGVTSVASGLLVVPDDLTKTYPLLCYQHGTSSSKTDVPSSLNFESNLTITFGGMGYVTITPDYLGLGESPGFHPYVHAATEASVGADGLRAARDFALANGVFTNDQVFLTGYSQGGHSSMALHRLLEQELSDEFSVTAAAHMSGPYSISGVMRDLLLVNEPYSNPAYLVNTMFSYQYVYGNIYSDLAEAVKPAYLVKTQQFYNGQISLSDLNVFLINQLTLEVGAAIPVKMFNDDFIAAIVNDPNHPANLALADNDVYDWAPAAPTRLYYCTADEQVPFENSIVGEAGLLAAGASDLDAVDVNSGASHTVCVTPAVLSTILFFLLHQVISDAPVSSVQERDLPFDVYPNPASGVFFVNNFPSEGEVRLVDLQGRVQLRQPIAEGDNEIRTGGLQNGLYFVEFQGNGGSFRNKLIIKN